MTGFSNLEPTLGAKLAWLLVDEGRTAVQMASSCDPVPPEQPMAPVILPSSISGMPPRNATTSSRLKTAALPELRWFRSIIASGPARGYVKTDGRAATFEEAKAQFRGSWEAWKAYEADAAPDMRSRSTGA
jgi:hypothetical protein